MKVVAAALVGQEHEDVVAGVATHRHRASAVAGREGEGVVAAAAIDDHIASAGERDVRSPVAAVPLNVARLAKFSAVEPGVHGQVRSTGSNDGGKRRVVHVDVEDVR